MLKVAITAGELLLAGVALGLLGYAVFKLLHEGKQKTQSEEQPKPKE